MNAPRESRSLQGWPSAAPRLLSRTSRRRAQYAATAAALLLSASPADSAPGVVAASPDVTISLQGVTADEDIVVDDLLGTVGLASLGPIPPNADVVAYHEEPDGDRLFVLDTFVELPGVPTNLAIPAGDVVRWDGVDYSIELDASAAGVPAGSTIDAITREGANLIVSFDTTVSLGGLVVDDADLVRHLGGTSFALFFDSAAAGVDAALDLDAAAVSGSSLFVSFETSGSVVESATAIDFDDEDVLEYDLGGGAWEISLAFDASSQASDGGAGAWTPADLDAVQVPEPRSGAALLAGSMLLVALRGRHESRVR